MAPGGTTADDELLISKWWEVKARVGKAWDRSCIYYWEEGGPQEGDLGYRRRLCTGQARVRLEQLLWKVSVARKS